MNEFQKRRKKIYVIVEFRDGVRRVELTSN